MWHGVSKRVCGVTTGTKCLTPSGSLSGGRRERRHGGRGSGGQMSSMPERDTPGQSGAPHSARPGEWTGTSQGGPPGQLQQFGSVPSGNVPPGGVPGQPAGGTGGMGNQQWGSQPGRMSPVSEAETLVTGRRIVQYLIDAFIVSIIPSLVSIPFDNSGRTSLHILGALVAFVLFVLIGLWYWVIRPTSHNGQTFAMKWLGLRVISKGGGPASMAQMFIRWICLIFDAIPYTWPLTGLVGLIVMLCSRRRQRIGDHLAGTLVISTSYGMRRRPQFAGADQTGTGGPSQPPADAGYSQSGTTSQPGIGGSAGMTGQPGPGSEGAAGSATPGDPR